MTLKPKTILLAISLLLSCKPTINNKKQQISDSKSTKKSRVSKEDTTYIDSNVFIIADNSKIAADSISYVGIKFKPYIHFEDFEVPIEQNYTKAAVKFSSNPIAPLFRTKIREGYREGVNFGGHYCFIEWGCGSPCRESVIVDVNTGIVYDGPSSGYGYDFKKGSRMVVCNPPGSDGFYLAETTEVPSIYIWNELKKKFEERTPLYQ